MLFLTADITLAKNECFLQALEQANLQTAEERVKFFNSYVEDSNLSNWKKRLLKRIFKREVEEGNQNFLSSLLQRDIDAESQYARLPFFGKLYANFLANLLVPLEAISSASWFFKRDLGLSAIRKMVVLPIKSIFLSAVRLRYGLLFFGAMLGADATLSRSGYIIEEPVAAYADASTLRSNEVSVIIRLDYLGPFDSDFLDSPRIHAEEAARLAPDQIHYVNLVQQDIVPEIAELRDRLAIQRKRIRQVIVLSHGNSGVLSHIGPSGDQYSINLDDFGQELKLLEGLYGEKTDVIFGGCAIAEGEYGKESIRRFAERAGIPENSIVISNTITAMPFPPELKYLSPVASNTSSTVLAYPTSYLLLGRAPELDPVYEYVVPN